MKHSLESRLDAIEGRNLRVEADKQREVSWTRRISIAVLTYFTVLVYLKVIENDKPFLNASVPTIGFILSTLLLKRIKNIWQKRS